MRASRLAELGVTCRNRHTLDQQMAMAYIPVLFVSPGLSFNNFEIDCQHLKDRGFI